MQTHEHLLLSFSNRSRIRTTILLSLFVYALAGATSVLAGAVIPNLKPFPDPTGAVDSFSTKGSIDINNPFFKSLGTNGRTCFSCHQPGDGWTITPVHVQDRFEVDGGLDPIFRPNDGATCPNQDVSTEAARRTAYALLLNKGLIRIGLPIPPNAEFRVTGVSDPYGCSTDKELSMYRRPLPSTNLAFLSTVMWDGRETAPGKSIHDDLISQARNATLGHAQGTVSPTDKQLEQIVAFQLGLFTAQSFDDDAGFLDAGGGRGGPAELSRQEFFIGINDPLGQNPTGKPFDPEAFTLFQGWTDMERKDNDRPRAKARESVARGEALFNTRPIPITGVGGLNDALGKNIIMGTCTTCHDSPNVGNHSIVAPLNIGTSDAARRTLDLPLFTLTCNATRKSVQTSDPGRAMISGKCADIGKVKGPILRGLAARAPYFHNGFASSLRAVVEFYDDRFDLGLIESEKADLVAFLSAL
jgi:cytochrome c peroxidase